MGFLGGTDDPAYFRAYMSEKLAEGTDLTTHELVQLQRNAFDISWLFPEKREAFVNMLDDYAAKHVHS
jgi:adenosine deaminase